MERVSIVDKLRHEEMCAPQNSNHLTGQRASGFLGKLLSHEIHPDDLSAVINAFQNRYHETEWTKMSETTVFVFNTLSLKHDGLRDCRNRLRCSPMFHGNQKYSAVQLRTPLQRGSYSYSYGQCLLFFSMGLEELVVLRLMKRLSDSLIEEKADYAFLIDPEKPIFAEVRSTYTMLLGTPDETSIQVVHVDDILQQEQLCDIGRGIFVVNHSCHGNIFSSEKC